MSPSQIDSTIEIQCLYHGDDEDENECREIKDGIDLPALDSISRVLSTPEQLAEFKKLVQWED